MTKGDRVRIIGGKYKGQTATLERRWPGGGKEWTVTLDGSYNNGIVKDDEIVSIKAKDSAVGEGEITYRGYLIYPDGTHIMFFKMGGSADQMGSAQTVEQARKFIDAHIVRGKDSSWGSAALMPMNYRKAAETANTQAREHRAEGKRISMAKGSLKSEFTAAAQAHYTAAGCWDDIVNALKQRSDAGEEAAESLWGSAVRQGQKAELLTAQLGIVTKAHDSLSFNTLFWAGIIAALIAKHYGPKETVGMGSYDLRNYQPERKTW